MEWKFKLKEGCCRLSNMDKPHSRIMFGKIVRRYTRKKKGKPELYGVRWENGARHDGYGPDDLGKFKRITSKDVEHRPAMIKRAYGKMRPTSKG